MDSNDFKTRCPEECPTEEVNESSNKENPDEVCKHKPKSRIHQGEVIEGKREKKTVQRLDMQVTKPKEKVKIESIGKGDKLGDIARVNHAIGKLKAPLLKPLHKILYDRPGAMASLRKHIRLFNGFPFDTDSEPYNKKKEKMQRFPKVQLKTICQILDLERSGNQSVLVERIMFFLIKPTNSGKPVILKKKKKKKTTKEAKGEKKMASKSKKQQLDSGKSKAIVTDSSSDEDEEESKNEVAEKSLVSVSRKCKVTDSSSEDSEEDEEKKNEESDGLEDSEDAEIFKSKTKKPSNIKKSTPKKVEDASENTLSDVSADDPPLKKNKKKVVAQKTVTAKPTPKTKKADSSSNRKRTAAKHKERSDSSDDDEPLIKMIKKPPTNEQLTQAVKNLLNDANLEEVTMKQICQQVYDLYPDFDLSVRKEFIKDTVKSLIT